MTADRTLRYAPHVAVASVGYVFFTYAAVPDAVMATYGVGFTEFGLLMSASLLAFVVAQWPASRLVARTSTTRVLLGGVAVHAVLAVALDLVGSFALLLASRFLWALAGGLVVAVGATHVARLYDGPAATRQQGVYGGMLTLGGAVGFLLAPRLVTLVDGFGIHALGGLLAVPALGALAAGGRERATASGHRERASSRSASTNPVVLLAAFAYVAVLASYVTLSTFVTSYFADVGIGGAVNAAVLAVASAGRAVGGSVAVQWSVGDPSIIAGATALATAGFVALSLDLPTAALVALPLAVMVAVSVPFGAVLNVAASVTDREGAALATVIAAGNLGALVLPVVTGALREATGDYGAAFLVLAALNGAGVAVAVALRSRTHAGGTPT